ncbi:hypothetical protein MN608_01635 [Microdochium nivale]|nr:hypothetical protein MN608_01635 [Microdochium nivale]
MPLSNPSDDSDALAVEAASRLDTELDILAAMYPDAGAVVYSHARGREVRFTMDTGTLVLRLPELYPVIGFPEILTASWSSATSSDRTGSRHKDLRDQTRAAVEALGLPAMGGDEVLDALILAFQQVVEAEQRQSTASNDGADPGEPGADVKEDDAYLQASHARRPRRQHKTVIIWLHHLLNTNKRKLALHPTLQPTSLHLQSSTTAATVAAGNVISGVTKPGYPGVLLYSGPRDLVAAHVSELRGQRWQAFQVRYDSDDYDDLDLDAGAEEGGGNKGRIVDDDSQKNDRVKGRQSWTRGLTVSTRQDAVLPGLWTFEHAPGTIAEAESIALAARSIRQESHREIFLAAVGVK